MINEKLKILSLYSNLLYAIMNDINVFIISSMA